MRKENLVNPFKGKYPYYLSFSMTVLLLALTFFLSMIVALQSQNIKQKSEKLEQKLTKKQNIPDSEGIENWKTYRNENYKFSIKHPANWEIEEVIVSLNEGDKTQILLSKENSDRIGDSIIFIVTSAEAWDKSIESGYNDFRGNNLFNSYSADISIRGEQDARPNDSITIKSPTSKHYITIIFDYKLTDKKELIDQILSTFEFIE